MQASNSAHSATARLKAQAEAEALAALQAMARLSSPRPLLPQEPLTCRACHRSADLGRERLLEENLWVWVVRNAARRRPQLSGTADSTVVISHAAMLQVEEQQRASAMERAKEEARRAAAQSSLNTPAPWAGSAPQVCERDRVFVCERPTSITPHPGPGSRRRFVLHKGMMQWYAR